jgi:solute carrier family 15 oligopeptide transporter 1
LHSKISQLNLTDIKISIPAILVLYLTIKLGYDDDTATVLFHVFTSLVYLFPLIGAILADSYLGKFQTILWLSCVYAAGSILIAIGAIPVLHLPASTLTVIGLLLIGLGSGGIKPCVSAFGGDQFKIPEQAKQLATFFSLFYFSINAGSLISTTITPILRENVHCFGDDSCFSLAFGVPAVLMVISISVFVMGKVLYTIKKPAGNMLVSVAKCVIVSIPNLFVIDIPIAGVIDIYIRLIF